MNNKIGALIIVIFVVGIASGIAISQLMNGTISNITPAEEEALQITDSGLWYDYDLPYAQAAVLIINDKNVAATLQKITVRGIECDWNDVYYWKGEIGSVSNLSPASNDLASTSVGIVVDGRERTFQQATGKIELDAYKAIVLYIRNAGNISSQNIPDGKVTIAVFTERNVYLEETSLVVEAPTIGFMGTEELTITKMQFTAGQITVVVNNTGESPVTINELWINGVKQTYTPQAVQANQGASVSVAYAWISGDNYQVKLVSSKGNTFMYTAVAP